MHRRTFLVSTATLAALACTSDAPGTVTGAGAALAPWQPVDDAFAGCHGACGAHAEAVPDDAVVQPGASIGQRTFCPVSGALFVIEVTHPSAEVAGGTLWFCCAGCATYFASHRDAVLRLRGLA